MSLKAAATDVLALLERGHYQVDERQVSIAQWQTDALATTRLYRPEELKTLRSQPIAGTQPQVQVVDGTTQVIAHEMANASDSPLALLNFASARNPGGGFLNGAKAQEEDICRCSGLYPCLLTCMEYYEVNRNQDSLLYMDYSIFSRDVPFFKTRGTGDFLANPFVASVITAPAPNTAPFLVANPGKHAELEATFLRRWQNVLCMARDQNMKRLLLGAWGCGAFGGDPIMAASTARRAIESHGAGFESIVFAIPNSGKQSQKNFDAFQKILAEA